MDNLNALEADWSASLWNPANFEEVVLEYQPRIYNFLYRLVRERQLAQDLTQETFLRAYSALCKQTRRGENQPVVEEGQPRQVTTAQNSSIVPWLYTIARNTAISELRRRKTVQFFSLRHSDDNSLEYELSPFLKTGLLVGGSEIESHFVLRDELEQALAKVGRVRLTALLLHLDGFTYEEISKLTSISLSGVKSRIFRAKQDLRRCFHDSPELVA